jgi:hypothetical protein
MALDPKTTKHSLQNALAMAQASQIAYLDDTAIKSGLAPLSATSWTSSSFWTILSLAHRDSSQASNNRS